MLEIRIKIIRELPFDINIYEDNSHKKSYLTIRDLPALFDIIRDEVNKYEEKFRNQIKEDNQN